MLTQLNSETLKRIVDFALEAASPNNAVAAMLHGPYAGGYADEKTAISTLLITDSDKTSLKYQFKRLNSEKIRLLIIDGRTFERDVGSEWLGGIFADNLLTPYEPLVNKEYLWNQEVIFKKRIVEEALNNLVLGFPEMSRSFMIKPEYFMFEAITRRAALFPPITYRFLNIARGNLRERNYSLIMMGFKAAINELINEGEIYVFDNLLKIDEGYASIMQRKLKHRLINLFRSVRSSITRYVLSVFPSVMDSFLEDYRIYRAYYEENGELSEPSHILVDPKKYIFIPTPSGVIPFSDRVTIEDFIRRNLSERRSLRHTISRLGGVLNAAYLLRFAHNGSEERIVAKVFKDWYGWKWFPIALWALGTRGFAVLGKTRLEREYTLNMLLSSHGINVPRIIHISPEEKIIFQEYIEGVSASKIIKNICRERDKEEIDKMLATIRRIGYEIARIHKLNISLGDCKPENVILTNDGRIFFVDLEQTERGGDKPWDIAEFLCYSGHYASFSPVEVTETITREFLSGYLEAGGEAENVKKSLSPRYLKVFSFFTPPHTLLIIANTCRKILETKTYNAVNI
jgi:tRNA A-37 threonylcarbamoyl transferase component Bud32